MIADDFHSFSLLGLDCFWLTYDVTDKSKISSICCVFWWEEVLRNTSNNFSQISTIEAIHISTKASTRSMMTRLYKNCRLSDFFNKRSWFPSIFAHVGINTVHWWILKWMWRRRPLSVPHQRRPRLNRNRFVECLWDGLPQLAPL